MKQIPVASPCIEEEEAKAVYDVVKSGWITMGQKVREFEIARIELHRCHMRLL